jgi:hypothetical protein
MVKRLLSIFTFVSIVLFSACQNEFLPENGGTTNTGTAGSFRAKIDGTQWEANNGAAASRQAGRLVLYGVSTDKKSIVFTVTDSGVHNYSLNSGTSSLNAAAYTDSSLTPLVAFTTNAWATPANYGNLNVTSIDTVNKKMSGTFSIQVYRPLDSLQRTITQGVFTDISYTTAPAPVPATDTFRVKVDGVDFTYNLLTGIKAFGMVSVSAAQTVAPAVGLSLPDTITAGTYAFDPFTYSGLYNPSTTIFLVADTGSFTILEHNTVTKRIRGNFHFHAKPLTGSTPTAQLTQGYFSVRYF